MSDDTTFEDFEEEPDDVEEMTVVHISEPHDYYGGRGGNGRDMSNTQPPHRGWLGNPFPVSEHGREECITEFETFFYQMMRDDRLFCDSVMTLVDARVACFCRHEDEDEPKCHLDIVKRAVDAGHVHRIAKNVHGIKLTDEQEARMADPEELL